MIMVALIILLYVSATVMSIAYAVRRNKKFEIAALILIIVAVLLQTALLTLLYVQTDMFPIFSVKYAIFMFAWALGIGAILVSVMFRGTSSIIGFTSPLAVLLIIVFLVVKGSTRELSPIFNTDIFPVHVLLAIISYGLFALSFIASIMYMFQETWLKHRRVIWLTKWLPSLYILDDLGYKTLTIGLPFLTLGILTGALWSDRIYGSYWRWDPKETWSLIIWLAYVFILHGRLSLGWKGKKFAWGSVFCFLLVVFSFIGVNFIFKGFHNF